MENNYITPIILAGGSGTRLWPLSRKNFPKQFHILNGNKTMLQQTILRLKNLKISKPIIICNYDHRFIVKDQMCQINTECDIVLEPYSKNTAPAITLATLLLKPETNILILAADHLIEDEKIFIEQVGKSLIYLNDNKIITFGIKPSSPNINYGYIETQKGNEFSLEVRDFKEKPNLILAKEYIKNENFFWNSGMFLFKGNTFLTELNIYNPKILDVCKKTVKTKSKVENVTIFDKNVFSKCPDKSIDHAIMEYTKKALMVPLNTRWSDIGSWNALREASQKNEDSNAIKGNVVTYNSKNSIIYSSNNKMIATNGIKDLIIIDTKDALLVSSTNNETNIKPLIKKIKKNNPEKIDVFLDENRPWGSFESITKEPGYQVKKITVKPKGQLSLQTHQHRSEHWVVVSGKGEVVKGKDNFTLCTNESIYIPQGELHSLKNNGKEDLIIIEVQTGSYLGEDDIQRFEDIYGRS